MTEWQDLGQVRPSNQEIIDMVYPVGAIYISVNSTNPTTLFGGTWQQLTDTFLYASTTADAPVNETADTAAQNMTANATSSHKMLETGNPILALFAVGAVLGAYAVYKRE